MRHLDLFSGIGGFALAARWLGWETVGFCEIDEYCRAVLRRHWPGVPIVRDIRYLAERADTIRGCADIITGGFPCQDLSNAGLRAGINGNRSGLWSDLCHIVSVVRPRYLVVENVTGLLGRGMGRVLGDLAEVGYDAEWSVISACALGAPHTRERLFIVAYPCGDRRMGRNSCGQLPQKGSGTGQTIWSKDRDVSAMGPKNSNGLPEERTAWTHQPRIDYVVDGVPRRMDRLRALGNAVVPQVAYEVLKAISEADNP